MECETKGENSAKPMIRGKNGNKFESYRIGGKWERGFEDHRIARRIRRACSELLNERKKKRRKRRKEKRGGRSHRIGKRKRELKATMWEKIS